MQMGRPSHSDFFIPATCNVFDAVAHQVAGAIHLARVRAELEAAQRKLQRLSTVDGLTGTANRRSFDERLAAECEWRAREGGSLSLLLVDADYFKPLNDALGHLHGDECLRRLARICSEFAEGEATDPVVAKLTDAMTPGAQIDFDPAETA